MDSILRFLVSLDDMIGVAATIISVVSGIVAIVAEVRGGKEQRKRSWVWNGIIFVSILVIVAAIIKRNIVEVPDVVGYTYQDACHVLSSQELKYSLVVDNGLYVTEQTPLAGTVVKEYKD